MNTPKKPSPKTTQTKPKAERRSANLRYPCFVCDKLHREMEGAELCQQRHHGR